MIFIFLIWQCSAWLIFRCRKQPEQRGAANGDLLAKGQSANASERSACRIEPVWDSVMKSRALSGPPNARFIVARAAQDTMRSSGSACGLRRQTEPKPSWAMKRQPSTSSAKPSGPPGPPCKCAKMPTLVTRPLLCNGTRQIWFARVTATRRAVSSGSQLRLTAMETPRQLDALAEGRLDAPLIRPRPGYAAGVRPV